MNNKKKLGAAFISLAVSGFAGLMLVAPGSLAVGGVVGTVLTEAKCDWQILSVPATFTLASAGDAKYEGAALELSVADQDLNVYVSGGQPEKTASGNTACIFYDAVAVLKKTRPEVVMSINATSFTAEYQVNGSGDPVMDTFMDVNLAENPLVVTMGACAELDAAWTSTPKLSLGTVLEDTAIEIQAQSDVLDAQASDLGLRCDNNYGVSLTLPGGVEPLGAGEEYTFRGIILTTTLTARTD